MVRYADAWTVTTGGHRLSQGAVVKMGVKRRRNFSIVAQNYIKKHDIGYLQTAFSEKYVIFHNFVTIIHFCSPNYRFSGRYVFRSTGTKRCKSSVFYFQDTLGRGFMLNKSSFFLPNITFSESIFLECFVILSKE